MGVAKTNFSLHIDDKSCIGCGLCQKACNVTALELIDAPEKKKGRRMKVNSAHCLGCGACISVCPTQSLSLIPLQRPQPPKEKRDLFKQILKEKKRLSCGYSGKK